MIQKQMNYEFLYETPEHIAMNACMTTEINGRQGGILRPLTPLVKDPRPWHSGTRPAAIKIHIPDFP